MISRVALLVTASLIATCANSEDGNDSNRRWSLQIKLLHFDSVETIDVDVPLCVRPTAIGNLVTSRTRHPEASNDELANGVRIRTARAQEQEAAYQSLFMAKSGTYSRAESTASKRVALLLGKGHTGLKWTKYNLRIMDTDVPSTDVELASAIEDVVSFRGGDAFALLESEFIGHERSFRGFISGLSGHPIAMHRYFLRTMDFCAGTTPKESRIEIGSGSVRLAWIGQ